VGRYKPSQKKTFAIMRGGGGGGGVLLKRGAVGLKRGDKRIIIMKTILLSAKKSRLDLFDDGSFFGSLVT
jgi:hypothetical protein